MTNQTLQKLADIIETSKEPIEVTLQLDNLILRTQKNTFWISLSIIVIAFSILLIATNDRREYNLEIGLALFVISISGFWKMQSINKTLIFDLHQDTLSIVPNFFLQSWFLSKFSKVDITFPLNSLPELNLLYYTRLKYHWTYRISFKKSVWTIYLLEFDKKETAQKVLDLLKH